jgi:hypothetical protein
MVVRVSGSARSFCLMSLRLDARFRETDLGQFLPNQLVSGILKEQEPLKALGN